MLYKAKNSQPSAPIWLKTMAYGGLAFLHFPIVFILMNAFVVSDGEQTTLTFKWVSQAFAREDVISAILLSLKVASVATFLALILGTMAAAAVYRRTFFGKNAITTILILPIALPGIITGIALLSAMSMLEKFARQNNLKIISFRPQRLEEEAGLERMPYQITLEGAFPKVISFVRTVETPATKIAVTNVQIASSDGASDAVTATISLVAYRQKSSLKK